MATYYTTINIGMLERVLQEGLFPVKPSWLPTVPATITLKTSKEEVLSQLKTVLAGVAPSKRDAWIKQYKVCLLAIEDTGIVIENMDCGLITRQKIPPENISVISKNLLDDYPF